MFLANHISSDAFPDPHLKLCSSKPWTSPMGHFLHQISFGGIPNSRNVLFLQIFLNLLRNPVEPDLALHQSLPDLLRNLRNPPEPCWTWPGACTSAHRSYSGLKTPLAYAVGELYSPSENWCLAMKCLKLSPNPKLILDNRIFREHWTTDRIGPKHYQQIQEIEYSG